MDGTFEVDAFISRSVVPIVYLSDPHSHAQLFTRHCRDEDMEVNPAKEKKLTNVRTVQADEKVFLSAPRLLNLEEAIG